MAKGISIGVAADTREFSAGVKKGIIEPLDGVAAALDDVSADGKDAGGKLEKSLDQAGKAAKDLGKDGKDAGSKLEKAMKEAQGETKDRGREHSKLGDVIDSESRRGGDAMKRHTKDATSSAKSDLDELGQEAKQNAAETFSSFDGSAESFVDGIQGTLGGIVSELGPIGAAAGAAGALGIGLIMSAMSSAEEDTAKYRERVAELGAEFIQAGRDGATSIGYLVDKLQDLATETDDVSLKELAKTASTAGSSFRDLAQSYAGNTKGLKEVWREADKRNTQLKEEAQLLSGSATNGNEHAISVLKQAEAQQKYVDYLGQSLGVAREAAEAQRLYAEAGGPELEQKAALIDSVQGSIDDAAASWEDYRDGETGALDPAAYLAGIQARTDAATGFAANLAAAQTQLSPEAYQYLVDQGIDFAPMLQSILDSGLIGEMNAQFSQAVDAGNTALGGITSDIPVTVTATADTKPAAAEVNKVTSAKPETTVTAKADTKPATEAIAALTAGIYTVPILTSLDLSGAESALNAFLNRTRTITVNVRGTTPDGKPVF